MPETVDLGVPALSEGGAAEIPPLEAPTLEPATPLDPPPSDPSAPAKRKRKRRTKAEMAAAVEPAPVSAEPTPEDVARLATAFGAAFCVAFDILAVARGDHWRLAAGDQKALGETWAAAWAPYMGNAGKYMPFIVAGFTTVGVVMPKVQTDQQLQKRTALGAPVETFTKPDASLEVAPPAPDAATGGAPAEIPIEPPKGRKRAGAPVAP